MPAGKQAILPPQHQLSERAAGTQKLFLSQFRSCRTSELVLNPRQSFSVSMGCIAAVVGQKTYFSMCNISKGACVRQFVDSKPLGTHHGHLSLRVLCLKEITVIRGRRPIPSLAFVGGRFDSHQSAARSTAVMIQAIVLQVPRQQ